MINTKLCMMVLLFELYLFILLSITMAIFCGCSSIKKALTEDLCSYPIKLKLRMIVNYVD